MNRYTPMDFFIGVTLGWHAPPVWCEPLKAVIYIVIMAFLWSIAEYWTDRIKEGRAAE